MADLHNQDDMPFEEPIVELNAPDGSVYRFRYGAVIPYAGEEYVVLLEMEKNADGEEQVLITRMVEEGDQVAFVVAEEEDVIQNVFDKYVLTLAKDALEGLEDAE